MCVFVRVCVYPDSSSVQSVKWGRKTFKSQSTRHPISCIYAIVSCVSLCVAPQLLLVQACFFVYTFIRVLRDVVMVLLFFLWFFSVSFLSYIPFFLSIFFGHTVCVCLCVCERETHTFVWVNDGYICRWIFITQIFGVSTNINVVGFFLFLVGTVGLPYYVRHVRMYMYVCTIW